MCHLQALRLLNPLPISAAPSMFALPHVTHSDSLRVQCVNQADSQESLSNSTTACGKCATLRCSGDSPSCGNGNSDEVLIHHDEMTPVNCIPRSALLGSHTSKHCGYCGECLLVVPPPGQRQESAGLVYCMLFLASPVPRNRTTQMAIRFQSRQPRSSSAPS